MDPKSFWGGTLVGFVVAGLLTIIAGIFADIGDGTYLD